MREGVYSLLSRRGTSRFCSRFLTYRSPLLVISVTLCFRMGPAKLRMEEKGAILALFREGLSKREVARRTRRSAKCVRNVIKATSAHGGVIQKRKQGSGRKRKTGQRTDMLLRREVLKNPFITAKELKGMHRDVLGDVAVRTLQQRLQKDFKLPCRRAAHKPLLTEKMRKQRLDFCGRYKHWTSADWRKVVFSDESAFKTISKGQRTVRRPVGANRFDSKYTVKTVKFPAGVMVWGCFSGEKGSGGLYFLDKNMNMNAALYMNVLTDHMLPFYESHENAHFLQDGAPCHRAKRVMEWLTENNVSLIEWPGHSPDLNPIENLWNELKRKIGKLSVNTVGAITEKLRVLWDETDLDYFKKLSDSMPSRINAVLNVKGEMTKY